MTVDRLREEVEDLSIGEFKEQMVPRPT